MTESIPSCPEQGYFLQPTSLPDVVGDHHVLGDARDIDSVCVHCGSGLHSLLRLNTADHRLDIGMVPLPWLPLLVCERCFVVPLNYSFTSAGEVLVEEGGRPAGPEPEGEGHIERSEPQSILLHAIPDRIMETKQLAGEGRLSEAAEWAMKFDWLQPQTQVGGVPCLINRRMETPRCSLCELSMPFLASVVADVTRAFSGEAAVVQLVYFLCRSCMNVACVPDTGADDYS